MTWTNWARSHRAEPSAAHAPTTVDGVRRAVEQVRERGGTLRPVGSGHSFSAAARPDDAHLTVDALTGLVDLDPALRRVTVLAGTTIRELAALLADRGLALDALGDIDRQTIAGAISTGTHGTGILHQSIGASVVAATLVTGEGRVLRVSETQRPELLPAVRLGLGALGVLVDVTLQCVPAFALEAIETAVELDAVLDDWLGLVRHTDHFEFYWFAATRLAVAKSNTRVAGPLAPRSAIGRYVDERLLTDLGHRALLTLGALAPASSRAMPRADVPVRDPRDRRRRRAALDRARPRHRLHRRAPLVAGGSAAAARHRRADPARPRRPPALGQAALAARTAARRAVPGLRRLPRGARRARSAPHVRERMDAQRAGRVSSRPSRLQWKP